MLVPVMPPPIMTASAVSTTSLPQGSRSCARLGRDIHTIITAMSAASQSTVAREKPDGPRRYRAKDIAWYDIIQFSDRAILSDVMRKSTIHEFTDHDEFGAKSIYSSQKVQAVHASAFTGRHGGDCAFHICPVVLVGPHPTYRGREQDDHGIELGHFDHLKRGDIPLWNPYTNCGMPFFATYQAALFYPLNFPHWFLRGDLAISLVYLIHIFLAGLFMYMWIRDLGGETVAAVFAGTAYMLCSFVSYLIMWPHIVLGHIWIPLIFLLLRRTFTGERWIDAALFVFGYLIFLILAERPRNRDDPRRLARPVALALCGLVLLPALPGTGTTRGDWPAPWLWRSADWFCCPRF